MYQFLIPLATGLASSAYDWWQSKQQEDLANELGQNNVRPVQQVPESQKRALQSAENQSEMSRLPGQIAIEGRLDQATANQVAMIERNGPGGPTSINAASAAYGNQQQKENELGIAASNMQLNNQKILRDELGQNAEWEQKAWDWNTGQPYLDKQLAIAALKGASLTNQNTAVKTLIGSAGYSLLGGMMGEQGGQGEDGGWFANTSAPQVTNPVTNPYNYKNPVSIDSFQKRESNTTENSNPNKDIPLNFTDKMVSSGFWGGRG